MRGLKISFALILALILIIGGCGASVPDHDEAGSPPAYDDHRSEQNYEPGENEVPRRRIYQGSLTVLVADSRVALDSLTEEVEKLGGYVENSRQYNYSVPTAHVTLRVPEQKFQELIGFAESLGEAEGQTVDTTDVTEEYVDLQARLNSRELHEQRLLALLEQGRTIDDLLKLEAELARVRTDIETLTGRLRYLDHQVDLAKLEVTLEQRLGVTEVPPLSPIGLTETLRRAGRTLSRSVTLFLNTISYLFIGLMAALPFIAPLAVLILVLRRIRRKPDNKDSTPAP